MGNNNEVRAILQRPFPRPGGRDSGVYTWVIPVCKYCGKTHYHGGGSLERNRPREFLGGRSPHCINGNSRGYVLIYAEAKRIIKHIRRGVCKKPCPDTIQNLAKKRRLSDRDFWKYKDKEDWGKNIRVEPSVCYEREKARCRYIPLNPAQGKHTV
jgi:hypothetical protein